MDETILSFIFPSPRLAELRRFLRNAPINLHQKKSLLIEAYAAMGLRPSLKDYREVLGLEAP
jgi:hypothetical protein